MTPSMFRLLFLFADSMTGAVYVADQPRFVIRQLEDIGLIEHVPSRPKFSYQLTVRGRELIERLTEVANEECDLAERLAASLRRAERQKGHREKGHRR